jgi:hypothetical protein
MRNHTIYITNSQNHVPWEYVPVKKRNKIIEWAEKQKQQE